MATDNSTAVQNASFRSAHSALVSAFQISGEEYELAEKNKLTSTTDWPLGMGLTGTIREVVSELGTLFEAALIARIAPKTFICKCGAPTCLGHKTNREWFDAISLLSNYVQDVETNAELRALYVERHFTMSGLRESIDDIAMMGEINRQTAEQQFNQVSGLLDEIESHAQEAITDALDSAGLIADQIGSGAVYH